MTTKHSFSIDFIIRKCKQNKSKAFIYARITIDGELKEISIKEHINSDDWNSKAEIVMGRGISAKTINEVIEKTRFGIRQKYRDLQENGVLITAEILKDAYLGIHTQLKGHSLIELLDYYHRIWQPKMKPGGFKNVETTIGYVKRFLTSKYRRGDVYLSQVNMELATDLEYFIRDNSIDIKHPCLGNGLGKHIQRFKTIIKWAKSINWIKFNPIEDYNCPLKRTKRKKLSLDELVSLEQKVFTDKTLSYVQDLFIYSCYTGLAFVDVMALRHTDFEYGAGDAPWCKIYRVKSDILCPVPLLRKASEILAKYKGHPSALEANKVFPSISHQHVNRCLQIIREAIGIETPMTFHVARHTFAKTVALKNGVPLETIQMMMGHTKITTTQIYADVDEEKIVTDMAGLEDRLEKKKETIIAANLLKAV
jgi:integrase/recombinase XerD